MLYLLEKPSGVKIMEKSDLTKKVLEFQQSQGDMEEVIEEVASAVYFSPILRKYLKREQRIDFLITFYKEIPMLIRNFNFKNKPFEAYLHFVTRRRVLSYLRNQQEETEIRRIVEDTRFARLTYMQKEDKPPTHSVEELVTRINRMGKISDNRILFFFLREYAVSDPAKLSAASRLTGYDEDWIQKCGEKLRLMVDKRVKRASELKRYRNRTYFLLFLSEKRLADALYESEKIELRRKISEFKKRLLELNKALSKTYSYPTHREIAMVTGNPKGSVDSALYYIKRTFMIAAENEKLSA